LRRLDEKPILADQGFTLRAITVRSSIILLPAALSLLLSCSSSRHDPPATRQPADSASVPSPLGALTQIAPGHCRVIATLLSVDTVRSAESGDQPAIGAPAVALVRVDSVLGYGAGFLNPIASGQRITVRFDPPQAGTGVSLGEQFRADLEEPGETVLGPGGRPPFRVSSLQRMNIKPPQERE
jgi:hypothetical protein